MCQRLLANPVIERYTVEVDELVPLVSEWRRAGYPGSQRAGPERPGAKRRERGSVSVASGSCCSRAPTASSTSQWARRGSSAARPRCSGTATAPCASVDAVVVPGGFAHGDYLRTGAIARFSPVMDAVAEFAAAGGPVVGICNGFQVLTEAGLLPGRAAEERRAHVRVRHGRARGGEHPLGAHQPGRRSGTCCASRSTTSRATTCATPTTLRAPARRRPHRGPLRRQPQRQPRRHRRHQQRGRQRRRPHAAPRAGQRRAARQRRRRRAARVAARLAVPASLAWRTLTNALGRSPPS